MVSYDGWVIAGRESIIRHSSLAATAGNPVGGLTGATGIDRDRIERCRRDSVNGWRLRL